MIIFDTDILFLSISNVMSFLGDALILGGLHHTGLRWFCREEQFLAVLGLCWSWEGLPVVPTSEEPSGCAKHLACHPARLQRAPLCSFLVWFFFSCFFLFFSFFFVITSAGEEFRSQKTFKALFCVNGKTKPLKDWGGFRW